MSSADLGGPLLASVSRSFYLTIRILPAALRGPIGLAYLLARASDTIADTADAAADVRLRHLAAFDAMIRHAHRVGLADLQREIAPPDASERELIAMLDRCLAWLDSLASPDRAEIADVMARIIRGQTLDLQRFPASHEIVALASAAELNEYTYLVAGCVGEFWTRICTQHLPRYSSLGLDQLCRLGKSYGQGLQLVNILRDAPADLRAGRCYLPADELRAAHAAPESLLREPAAARPVFAHWVEKARTHLDDGFRYLEAVRPARLRAACFLPWYLGHATLRMIDAQPPLETAARIKVLRSTVRAALWQALPVAFSNRALARLHRRH